MTSQSNFSQKSHPGEEYNIYGLLTKREVKMAGYSFLRVCLYGMGKGLFGSPTTSRNE